MILLVSLTERLDRARRLASPFGLIAVMLLVVQATILVDAAPHQAPTIDEIWHLPAGISYYQRGEFWCYHHNPPVMRWLYSWPAVIAGAKVDYSRYVYRAKSRQADFEFGRDFLVANQDRYLDLFLYCRPMVMLVSVACGWLIWWWSRELFGGVGGLISLWLWVFLPESLTHGVLLTTDMGAAYFGFLATYLFWRYLRVPSVERALLCGVALGVAEGTKFSCIVLPLAWGVLAVVRFLGESQSSSSKHQTNSADGNCPAGNEEPLTLTLSPPSRGEGTSENVSFPSGSRLSSLDSRRADGGEGRRRREPSLWAVCGHALVVLVASVIVLNDLYLFDGFGKPLEEFPFFSETLTRHSGHGPIGNRFQQTWLARLPVPLPEQYVLGFDAQLADLDHGEYQKYLRGELKKGNGWWYYYLYGCLVKLPLGTLAVAGLAMSVFVGSRVFVARHGSLREPEAFRFGTSGGVESSFAEQPGALRHPARRESSASAESPPHPNPLPTTEAAVLELGRGDKGKTPHPGPLPARPGRGDKAKTATPLWLDELALLVPFVVYFVSVSHNTGLQYFRYLLPCFPFLCVFCGRLGSLLGRSGWKLRGGLLCLLLSIPVSVLRHHPHYLPYFSEAVGGPEGGPRHLADSSIDWGEGLLALRDWLTAHRPGEPLKLAYFGTMAPQVAGFDNFELPPFGPGFQKPRSQIVTSEDDASPEIGPVPGLQAVSVNYVLGISFPAPNGRDLQGIAHVPQGAYAYYARFQPVAKPGYSIWVFDLSVEDVNRVRAELGLPPWSATDAVKDAP